MGSKAKRPPTLAAVQAQIGRAGGTANPAVTAAIRYVLTGGSAADRKGIVSVVTAAAQRITHVLATTNRDLVARARELAAVAQPLQHTYLATLGRFLDGRAQRSELTRALAARYRHPAYDTADALAARIANVQQVTPHTTAGELTQLRMLIDHTLAAGVQQDADLRLRLLHRYTIDQEQLERGIDRTKAATLELITRAHTEWDRSFTRLEGRRKRWRRDTAERYHKRAELWNRRHAALAAGRDRWLEAATRTGIVAGSRELAVQWDLEANALIADAERVVIPSFAGHTPDLSALVHAATGGSVLADLIEQAEYLQSRAQDTNVVVAASLPQITTGAAEAQVAHSLTQTIFDQVTERAAVLSAIRARELFATQREAIDSGIESANQDLHDKLTNRMEAAGYRRDGALWRRQSIIGSTVLGGTEWETHQVAVYRDFIAPGFSGRTDLSTPALTGLSGTAIATLVDQATEEMARYQVLIFGRSEQQKKATTKDGKRNERYVTPVGAAEFRDTLAQVLREAEAAWKRGANSERTGDTEGLFNYHVGYDPVMEGESIKQAGYGQLGVIMGAFFTNEARLHRGHTALMTPIHRKPLWDDDADNDGKSDSLFGAPTVATVVDVGVAVALTAAGAGPLAVAALSLVDDVLFTTADVATGYQDAAATFGQLGIRAVTSVAGAATGGLINGVGGQHASGFLVQGLSGTIGSGVTNTVGAAAIDAGFAMATSGINTVMAAGITTAFTGGEWDDFTGGLDSWEHWRGTTIAGVRGAAGSLAGDFFTQDGTGETIVAGTSIDTKALAGAASLSTTAITAGAEYAITDRTTVNLAALNFKYQADGRESTSSTGLLELRLGGAGSSLHLGTGGYRADLGTIAKTIGGRSDVLGVTRAKLAGEGSHALGVLNTANYLAIGGMRQLSQEIWGRKVAVAFEDLGEDYGYYNHSENSNRIVINRRSNTNDREDVAVLAAGAAHEGQHRYDRTFHGRTSEYSAHRSGAAVYLNLMHGLGLKGNDRLMQSITAGLMSEQSKQTNTGPVDHWKLTADGGLAFDGDGWLKTADGKYIRDRDGNKIGAQGVEAGLIAIMQLSGVDMTSNQAANMLAAAGFRHNGDENDPSTWMWNTTGADGEFANIGMILNAKSLAGTSFSQQGQSVQNGLFNRLLDYKSGWQNLVETNPAVVARFNHEASTEGFASGEELFKTLNMFVNVNDDYWSRGGYASILEGLTTTTVGGVAGVMTQGGLAAAMAGAEADMGPDAMAALVNGRASSFVPRFQRDKSAGLFLSEHALGSAIDIGYSSGDDLEYYRRNNAKHALEFELFDAATANLEGWPARGTMDAGQLQQTARLLGEVATLGVTGFVERFEAVSRSIGSGAPSYLQDWIDDRAGLAGMLTSALQAKRDPKFDYAYTPAQIAKSVQTPSPIFVPGQWHIDVFANYGLTPLVGRNVIDTIHLTWENF